MSSSSTTVRIIGKLWERLRCEGELGSGHLSGRAVQRANRYHPFSSPDKLGGALTAEILQPLFRSFFSFDASTGIPALVMEPPRAQISIK